MSHPSNVGSGINLGKPSLRRRLEAYYSLIAPDAISNEEEWKHKFELIYQKYGGTAEGEAKLASKLSKKYGTTVRLLLAKEPDNNKNKQRQAGLRKEHQHNESYYELTQQQQNSGILVMTSAGFDPTAAMSLDSEKDLLQANHPWLAQETAVLNHLDQCRKLLPDCDPLQQTISASAPKKPKEPKKTRPASAFAALAAAHSNGPFVLLHDCMMQRQRVRVLIRYVNGIRGTLTGYVVSFDKHMNMLLRDVDEVYTPRPITDGSDEKVPSNLEIELQRRTRALQERRETNGDSHKTARRWSVRQRYMKQIMVRGDVVVLVYRAERERFSWPKTSQSPVSSRYASALPLPPPEQRVGSPGCLIFALHQKERLKSKQK